MPIKRRIPRTRRPEVEPLLWARLIDAPLPEDATDAERFFYDYPDERKLREAWAAHRAAILAEWVRKCPGTRPSCWWEFDAPRQPLDGTLPEPRLRLGGKGTPAHEALNYVPEFEFGMPASWVENWCIEYYNGSAKDIYGNPIGTEYREGKFIAENFDPNDPPTFEAEAAYLKRLGQLAPGESRRLRMRDFEPEVLPRAYWPNDDQA